MSVFNYQPIVEGVFSYLTPRELCKVSLVCRDWKRSAYSDIFWKPLALRFSSSTKLRY